MNRPGVMLYFDIRPAVDLLSNEEKGRLFSAILNYAELGELPELSGALAIAWEFIRPRIDRDSEKYSTTCSQRKYAAYCREARRAGHEPEEFSEWLNNGNNQPISTDNE